MIDIYRKLNSLKGTNQAKDPTRTHSHIYCMNILLYGSLTTTKWF